MRAFLMVIFLFCSCSAINQKATITKNDFEGSDKQNYIKIITNKLSDYNYNNVDEFKYILEKIYKDNEQLNGDFNHTGLINEVLNSLNKDVNIKDFSSNVSYNNEIIYIYDAFIRAILGNPYEVYNSTWNSKTIKPTYIADELFMYILDDKEDLKDILKDMKIKFNDYPLNEYNKIIYEYNYGKFYNIDSEIFKEARKNIRKINSKFYPELLMYKPRLILSVDFLELIYYSLKKDKTNLLKLKNEINLSNVDDKINLNTIKELLDLELKSIGG